MSEMPKEKIECELTTDLYPDVYSMIKVTLEGRKQTCDQVYEFLSQKFNIIDTAIPSVVERENAKEMIKK